MISEETARRIAAALERLAFAQEQANEIAAIAKKGNPFPPPYLKPMCLRCYPPCFRELGHPRDDKMSKAPAP